MKIAIAACADLPSGSKDDQLLIAELNKLGATATALPWDQIVISNFDAVILRSSWDYHFHIEKFKNWVLQFRGSRTLLLNSPELVIWNCNKSYLAELQEESINIVPSFFVAEDLTEAEILNEISLRGWKQLVVKPTISATAHLTFKCDAEDLIQKINLVKKHSSALVQPYLSNVESQGEASLIFFNDEVPEFSHAIVKRPKHGDFRVQPDFGGQLESITPSPELLAMAKRCFGVVVDDWIFARVDILNWESEPMLGELEMIEPNLFFEHSPLSALRLAQIIFSRVKDFEASR